MELANKVAIVTGGNKGIGRAIALELARHQARLAIIGRDKNSLSKVEKEILEAGSEVFTFAGDLTDDTVVTAFAKAVKEHFGKIDILVNNAGVGYFAPVADLKIEHWDRMFNLNVRSVFLLTQKVLPELRKAGEAFVVNVASLASKNAFVGGGGYAATKHALLGFSRCLMLEERKNGINVLTVCPGSVKTEFFSHHHDADEVLKKHILQPENVAQIVVQALQLPANAMVSEIDIRPANP